MAKSKKKQVKKLKREKIVKKSNVKGKKSPPKKSKVKEKKITPKIKKTKETLVKESVEKKTIRIFTREKKPLKKDKSKEKKVVAPKFIPPVIPKEEPPEIPKVLIPSPSDFFKLAQDFNHIILNLDENINFDLFKVSWELLYSLKSNIERKIKLFREVDSKKELDRIFKTLK